MIIPIEPGEREDGDVAAGDSPEKGFLVLGTSRYAAASRDAVRQARLRAHLDAVPDRGAQDPGPGADVNAAEHARGGVEAGRRLSEEDTLPVIEVPASLRKGSSALERFERRAQEIARAAEVREWPAVEEPTDLLAPLRQQGRPEVGDESRLSGGNSGKDPRGNHADPRVKERVVSADSEARDSVPFGLKRRIPVGIPILHDEEGDRAPGFAVTGEQGRDVRIDDGVRVDHEKISAREPVGGVSQSPRSAQDLRLREEAQVREIRRAIAQMAFDLFAKMMKIDARFKDSEPEESFQARPDERHVGEGKERLGD